MKRRSRKLALSTMLGILPFILNNLSSSSFSLPREYFVLFRAYPVLIIAKNVMYLIPCCDFIILQSIGFCFCFFFCLFVFLFCFVFVSFLCYL